MDGLGSMSAASAQALKEYLGKTKESPSDPIPTNKVNSEEVRVVDPITGGEKGTKLARFSLIPPEFLLALAEHYGKGAKKYADRNWEKGYKWSLSIDALERHLNAWKGGEWVDQETGSNHLIAVVWHAIALFIFQLRGLGTNDIKPEPNPLRWYALGGLNTHQSYGKITSLQKVLNDSNTTP